MILGGFWIVVRRFPSFASSTFLPASFLDADVVVPKEKRQTCAASPFLDTSASFFHGVPRSSHYIRIKDRPSNNAAWRARGGARHAVTRFGAMPRMIFFVTQE